MRITNKILGGERFKWKEISVEMFYLIDLQNKVTLVFPTKNTQNNFDSILFIIFWLM